MLIRAHRAVGLLSHSLCATFLGRLAKYLHAGDSQRERPQLAWGTPVLLEPGHVAPNRPCLHGGQPQRGPAQHNSSAVAAGLWGHAGVQRSLGMARYTAPWVTAVSSCIAVMQPQPHEMRHPARRPPFRSPFNSPPLSPAPSHSRITWPPCAAHRWKYQPCCGSAALHGAHLSLPCKHTTRTVPMPQHDPAMHAPALRYRTCLISWRFRWVSYVVLTPAGGHAVLHGPRGGQVAGQAVRCKAGRHLVSGRGPLHHALR